MTQFNLNKIAALLSDTFVSIESIETLQGHIFVVYHTRRNVLEVAYEPIPEANDDKTVCMLLLKLQKQLSNNIHPSYFTVQQ